MPTIKVPEDFEIEFEVGDEKPATVPTCNFVTLFLVRTVLRDHRYWGANTERLFAAMEIRTAFKGKKPGDEVEITEDQWKKLCECTSSPSEPYNVVMMMSGKSFFDAILKPHGK